MEPVEVGREVDRGGPFALGICGRIAVPFDGDGTAVGAEGPARTVDERLDETLQPRWTIRPSDGQTGRLVLTPLRTSTRRELSVRGLGDEDMRRCG